MKKQQLHSPTLKQSRCVDAPFKCYEEISGKMMMDETSFTLLLEKK